MHRTQTEPFEEVYFSLCKRVDTPTSLGCWLRYKYGELRELTEKSVKPKDYLTADSFSVDYLVTSFVRKYSGFKTGVDLEAVALEKLAASEAQCARTNQRILGIQSPFIEAVILTASAEIARILGNLDVTRVLCDVRWGPGATESIRRKHARFDKKIKESPIRCTRLALPHLRRCLDGDIHWGRSIGLDVDGEFSFTPLAFKVVDENRVLTVPKDARSNRVIAAEPTGNSLLQQGAGRYIRKRLKRFGVDLDDQRVNQTWASTAQELGLATLDLSSASDTISTKLVELLLPLDWWIFLDSLRSPFSRYPDGTRLRNNRFASMGNAYIFELETLLFYCLTKAAVRCAGGRGVVSAYGDDIICPSQYADPVIAVLEWAGFTVNLEKSFTGGRFYESCGKHYFDGFDVTPVYQKEPLKKVTSFEFIRCHNRLYRWGARSTFGCFLDDRITGALRAISRLDMPGWRKFRRHSGLPCSPDEIPPGDEAYLSDDSTGFRLVGALKSVRTYQQPSYAWFLRNSRVVNTAPAEVHRISGEVVRHRWPALADFIDQESRSIWHIERGLRVSRDKPKPAKRDQPVRGHKRA